LRQDKLPTYNALYQKRGRSMRAIWIATALSLLTCASADALALIVMFFPKVHAVAVTLPNAEDVHTGRANDILYRQPLAHGELVQLSAPLNIALDRDKRFAIPAGALLFATGRAHGLLAARFADTDESEKGPAVSYCTNDVTFTGHNMFGRSMAASTCLIDNEGDGQFDEAYAGFAMEGQAGYLIGDLGTRLDAGVTYTHVDPQEAPIGELAIVLSLQFLERPTLQLALITPRGHHLVADSAVAIPSQLPATIEIRGAQIEVLSLERGQLQYRVRGGFNADESELHLERGG
jgi:hypothetical protein